MSVGLGMAFLYIAEISGAVDPTNGLGSFIQTNMMYSPPAAFAGILAMALLGLVLYVAIEVLERIVCRWKHVTRRNS